MTTYYILTPEGKIDSTTTVEPTNPSILWTDVDPEDFRQTWDFVNSAWFWTKDTLKQLVAEKRAQVLQADITINSVPYPYMNIPILDWCNTANMARTEDPEANRSLVINSFPLPTIVTLTNAELVELVDGLVINISKTADIMEAIFVGIDNDTYTNKAGVDGAWDTLDLAYVAPTKLPTLAEVAAAAASIPATFDDLADGSTNKAYTGTEKSKLAGVEAGAINTTSVNTLIATAISNLVNGAPSQLDTINELAAALGNDPNLASTLTTALAGKSSKSSFSALSSVAAHGISNAATDAPTDAVTNYNVVTTLLGALVGAVNDANTKQNAIATKYNDLAGKFNTLLGKVTALETAINNLKGAGAA